MEKDQAARRLKEIQDGIHGLLTEAGGILQEIETRETPYEFGAYSTATHSWISLINKALCNNEIDIDVQTFSMEDTIREIQEYA